MHSFFTQSARLLRQSGLWIGLLVASVSGVEAQTVVTFSNPATLTLEEITGGPASIYPSTINISGLTSVVRKVTVTLRSLNHDFPDDFDILLVGPSGTNVMLMSDCVSDNPLFDVTIILDDDAADALPDNDPAIVSGAYRPANYGIVSTETMPSPAPQRPWGSRLDAFTNTIPNGTWSLYVVDDLPENGGTILDGWTLSLTLGEPAADLAVSQSGNMGLLPAGGTLVYTIVVTNRGPANTIATLSDTLPTGVEFVSATTSSGSCAPGPGVVNCALGNLLHNQAATVSLTVRHLSGGALTNFATVTGNAVDLLPDNNVSSTTTAVGAAPDLGVTGFAAPNPAVVRLPITLSLSVTNSGSLAATNVVLTNRLPAGFVFLGATSTLGSCSHAGGVVTCGLGNLAIGAAAQVSISARPEIPGQLTNQFGVTTSGVDPAPLDNTGASGILVQDAADLRLTLASSPASVPLGRDWIAVIAVTNLGPGTTTTKLVQHLGSGVQFISAGGAAHACTNDNGIIVCDLGPLAARTNALFTLTTRPTNLGSAANSLSVTGELVELNPPDNAIALGTTVVPAADLAVSGSVAPNPVWAGETTTYSLAVTNAGPLAANSASLSSLLPAGAVFISANSDHGSCLLSNQTVRCNFGALATGVLARVSITARLNSTGPAPLLASTAATEIDPVSSNNLATIVARVVTVSGQFSTAQIATLPEVGGAIPYPATLQVSGLTATVARVRVTLTNLTHSYPDDLDILLVAPGGQRVLLMSDAGGSFDAIQRTLVFDATAPAALPDSTALTSGTFRPADYEAGTDTFPAPAPAGPYSTNLFDLTGIDPNGTWSLFIVDDSLKDSGTLGGWSLSIATLDPIADLQLTTTTAANPAPVAAPLEILCEITNRGPALATDLRFTNLLSTDVVFGSLSALPSQGGCTVAGGVVTCALGALAPGESAQVVILLTPIEEGQLTNLAFVGATAVDFLPANNATTLIVTSLEPPVIVIDPFDQTALEGSPVTFTGSAVGAQPLDYQWLRDGIPIPGATTTQLTIATTVAADTGFYQLRVSNAVGVAVSVPAFLLVSGPPFVSVIASQVILEDGMTPALDFVVGDTETSADQILVTGDSSDHLIVPQENILFGGFDSNRTVQIIPLPGRYGEVAIGVYADDGSGNITLRTFLLTVTHVNRPPAISDIANQAAGENSPFSVNFIATDLESSGDSLSYSGSSSNPEIIPTNGIVFSGSGSNRVALVTPATNSFGTAVLTFTVHDSNGASSSDSFTVTVAQLNVHPFVEAIANLTIAEDSGLQIVQLNGIASGPTNEPPGNIQVFAFSDRPAIIPNPVVDYTNGSTTGTLTFAPLTNAAGIANISVVINDGATTNGTFLRTFTVQVTPVNDPPTLQVSATASTVEDTVIRLPIAVSDVDNAPSAITLTAESANPTLIPPANISFGGAGASRSVTITPASTRSGTAVLTLIATDPQGAQTQAVLTVTIHATNSPPTMDNIANLTLPEDAGLQTITLTGISAGGVGETENVLLSAQSSQPGIIPNPSITHATNASTGSLQFTPAANATGSVTITVTLDDQQSFNRLSTRSFTVSISPAIDPPVISVISNQVTAEDTALTIPFTVSTADAPAYAVTLSGSSSNATLVPATNIVFSGAGTNRSVTITPARDLSGTNLITLVASSGAGTASRSFTLTVNAVNDLPTINPISNFVTNRTSGNTTFLLPMSGINSGASNESQSITITAVSSNPTLIPNPTVNYTNGSTTGTLGLRPAKDLTGTNIVTVTVTDGSGASTSIVFLAYILNNNVLPTISGLTNIVMAEDATVGPVPFSVRDSQTPASNLTLSAVSSNPFLLPASNLIFGGNGTNRTLTLTPLNNQSGTAAITLSVIDANFGLSNLTFNVTVNPVNDAPTIAPVPNVTLDEDASPTLVPINVADVDSPPASLVITALSSNTTLLPNANILPVGVGTNRGLVITPAANQSGTTVVTVRVSDGVASNSTTFTLSVNAQNDPPSITGIAAQSTDEDTATAPIPFIISDTETPASLLALAANSSNPTLVPTNRIDISGSGSNRTVVVTPAPDQSGTTVITITAADASNAVASTSFLLTVLPVNETPTLAAIGNMVLNESAGAQTVALTGIGSGSTNKVQPVTVTASTDSTNLISNLTVDYPGAGPGASLRIQLVPNSHGTAVIIVTVNDGQPANALTSRAFSVVVQASPTLSQPADVVTSEDTPAIVAFSVDDPDDAAGTLIVSATSTNPLLLPVGALAFSGTGSNRNLRIAPATNASGSAQITLRVTDPLGGVSQRNFYLEVQPTVDSITFVSGPTSLVRTVGEAASFEVVVTSSLLPLSYQWFREGVLIPGATGSVLSFASVSTTNSGAYTMTASNADGPATSPAAFLFVELPLRIESLTRSGANSAISFITRTGFSYTVEFKNSLSESQWQSLPPVPGTGGTVTVEDRSAAGTMRFYRVRGVTAP